MMNMNLPESSKSSGLLPLVAVIFLGAFAYLLVSPRLGFVSDDYIAVYGGELMPYRPLSESIRQNNPHGAPSPMRMLNAAINGYPPYLFGGAASHVMQTVSHLLCAASIYWLLRRLNWDQFGAALAFGFFASVPWVFQSVSWWSAGGSQFSTLLFVLTLHTYLSWSQTGKLYWSVLAIGLIFLGLCIYELWFTGFVAILAIEMYWRRHEITGSIFKRFWIALKKCWFYMIPFMIWGAWAALTYVNPDRRPTLPMHRLPIVFVSIHYRVIHWATDIPWSTALRDGTRLLLSPGGAILLAAAIITGALALLRIRPGLIHRTASNDLLANLLLGWGLFLGGRMVFVLQGAIATHTRHNYGGAVGFAVGVAAIVMWLANRQNGKIRNAVYTISFGVLIILSITSAGICEHFRKSSQAEKDTVSLLTPLVGNVPMEEVFIVTGDPTHTRGEKGYFYEFSGAWLEELLRRNNPDVWAFVVSEIEENGEEVSITIRDHTGWRPAYIEVDTRTKLPTGSKSTVIKDDTIKLTFDKSKVKIFEWNNGILQPRT